MMRRVEFTSAFEECLRGQALTADVPGPVLRDFELILDFVGTKGVEPSGKYNLLPLSCIPELAPHLSRVLSLNLKRPQLRSHPYLQGLNLLLRASGLAQVKKGGAKARLILDPAMLDQWRGLNPTEQYFNLLEAWLRLATPEIVGERPSAWGPMLPSCMQTWLDLPENNRRLKSTKSRFIYLVGIGRSLYQLALLDLFGLLDIKQPPREIVGGWMPARINPTPFGDAVFALLGTKTEPFTGHVLSDNEDEEEQEGEEEKEEEDAGPDGPRLGAWQPVFQPYFPEWRENLVFPKREPREGTYLFKVSLGTIRRRIAMPADATLDDLVGWILRSVNFDSDHLFEITYRDQLGTMLSVSDPMSGDSPCADEILLGTLPLDPGQTMDLLYDFGDCWRFTIKLEHVEPPDAKAKAKTPRIVESHGEAPEQYPSSDD
jgi:hypothetical protein